MGVARRAASVLNGGCVQRMLIVSSPLITGIENCSDYSHIHTYMHAWMHNQKGKGRHTFIKITSGRGLDGLAR